MKVRGSLDTGKYIRNSCPVCGLSDAKTKEVFIRDYRGMPESAPFARYTVRVCPNCGMAYAGSLEENIPLGEYYAMLSRYEGGNYVLSSKTEQVYEHFADFLEEAGIPKDAAVLDIGCAFGGLLKKLKDHGYRKIQGIEPSETNARYAKDTYGIDVCVGSLGGEGDFSELFGRFDLVILSGVLEHLLDPGACIKECKNFLCTGGMIGIRVPELKYFADYDNVYQEFSIEHINYFSMDPLMRLFARYDFTLVSKVYDPMPAMGLGGTEFSLWKYEPEEIILGDGAKSYSLSMIFLDAYLSRCQKVTDAIRMKMLEWDLSKGYYIWGASTQTAALFQLGIFEEERVDAIVDSSPKLHGKKMYGCRVDKPKALLEKEKLPIIISSQYAQVAIEKKAKEMGLENELILLF